MGCVVAEELRSIALPFSLLQAISAGQVTRLKRFVVEPYEQGDEWGIRTIAVCQSDAEITAHFPFVAIDHHANDEEAMSFALEVFNRLRQQGYASSNEVANWRRALMTLVPHSTEAC